MAVGSDRICASRTRFRTYSLGVLYARRFTSPSMNLFIVAGNEMWRVVIRMVVLLAVFRRSPDPQQLTENEGSYPDHRPRRVAGGGGVLHASPERQEGSGLSWEDTRRCPPGESWRAERAGEVAAPNPPPCVPGDGAAMGSDGAPGSAARGSRDVDRRCRRLTDRSVGRDSGLAAPIARGSTPSVGQSRARSCDGVPARRGSFSRRQTARSTALRYSSRPALPRATS